MSDTLWPHGLAARQASLFLTISWSLLEFMSIELAILSHHLILCYPPLFLPSVFPSIRAFSNGLSLHINWPKYWSWNSIKTSNFFSLVIFQVEFLEGKDQLFFLLLKRLTESSQIDLQFSAWSHKFHTSHTSGFYFSALHLQSYNLGLEI